jgi:hypothetical protein
MKRDIIFIELGGHRGDISAFGVDLDSATMWSFLREKDLLESKR